MLLCETDGRGVARLTLNRPDLHNAFNAEMIDELRAALDRLAGDDEVRIVVLTGAGKSFSAGADVNWMRAAADYGEAENLADATRLADMLHALDTLPKPTVARVNGGAFGGGVGLICACDIAIAAGHAKFGVTEVKLGLMPSVISPYVVRAIGPRAARRFVLTGEIFDAGEATRIGLVHENVPEAALDGAVDVAIDNLLQAAPGAQAEAKVLVRHVAGAPIDDNLRRDTAERIAKRRATAEARDGLSAFLEKRRPGWVGE